MIRKGEIAAAIAGSNLFGTISSKAIRAIAEIAHEEIVPPDTTVVQFGDPGANCYIIAAGSVRLFRTGEDGAEYDFSQYGPGESFGEVALLSNESMSVSVKTAEETRFVVIPRDQFGPIMRKYPEVTAAVGKIVSLRLRRISSTIGSYAERQFESPRLRWVDFVLILD